MDARESWIAPNGAPTPAQRPLVVDLDGTLVRCDTLFDAVVRLIKRRPLALLQLPWWMLRGKAAFKSAIHDRVDIDAGALPYDERVLARLREAQGHRPLVLCTASDRRVAHAVAQHLQLFDVVMSSEPTLNLRGHTKGAALVQRFGSRGFDYAGNDGSDVQVFVHAHTAWFVNPTPTLRRARAQLGNVQEEFPGPPQGLAQLVRALRPLQWVKNLLVFVPLLATIDAARANSVVAVTLAFIAFCATASAIYLVNDVLDVEDDRRHPRKRHRPIAAGSLSARSALLTATILMSVSVAVSVSVSWLLLMTIAIYAVSALAYSLLLKRVPLLDTLVLAGLYTLRILAGAAAITVVPSVWLLAFSMFWFLSLALAKRHSELVELGGVTSDGMIPGRQYRREDLAVLISQGSASGYAAVLVLAMYINSDVVREHYRHPEIIWLICPLLLYWINKLWLNSQRREINDDPIVWAVTNRVSRAIAVLCVVLLLLARYTTGIRWPS